jgi:hypothetical protein
MQLSQSYSIFAVLKHEDRCIFRVKTSWANMVVTASLEVLREPPKPLNIAVLKHIGGGGGVITTIYIYSQVRSKCK